MMIPEAHTEQDNVAISPAAGAAVLVGLAFLFLVAIPYAAREAAFGRTVSYRLRCCVAALLQLGRILRAAPTRPLALPDRRPWVFERGHLRAAM